MWHPTDEDLILHFYGEARGEDEARVDAHLAECSTCHAAWVDLAETLKLVDAAAIPEPAGGFESMMWARVRQALPARQRPWWSMRLVPVTALAAVAVIAVVLGAERWIRGPASRELAPPARADASRTRERVLLTALDDHFEQTQVLLVELLNAPQTGGGERDFERATADDLVTSGRLYRATAQQNGDLQFAQMLDDLESVLVEVARRPDRVDRRALASLRARIDDAGLLFKVRAVTNEIHRRQKSLTDANE